MLQLKTERQLHILTFTKMMAHDPLQEKQQMVTDFWHKGISVF